MRIYASSRLSQQGRFATIAALLVALLVLLLSACGSSQLPPVQAAVDIHKGDACAVCGMYIDTAPGPRAEAWVQGYKAPLKFGSTRDFFAYVTDPENTTTLQQLWVQDSAQINWLRPSNEARTFVDARTAWYVAWQPLQGLMGPTFASFAAREDADAFVRMHGGEVLGFAAVTPELTSLLGYACPVEGSPAFALGKGCAKDAHAEDASLATQSGLLRRPNSVPHESNPGPQGNRHTLLDGKAH